MAKDMAGKGDGERKSPSPSFSFVTIFMHADAIDKWLMAMGFFGSVGSGFLTPLVLIIMGRIVNNLGSGPSSSSQFIHNVNQDSFRASFFLLPRSLLKPTMAIAEGYCWTRTGDRQAMRMRTRYLKATLRQDVEYFDLNAASLSEVITSVSSDSLIIQDVIAEKVPNFINNATTFVGSYVVGFVLMWRLALVAFPTALLLVIPGIVYGRMFMDLAKKIRDEYEKAGAIAEQAVSSIRTLYSFAAERRTMSMFSNALEHSVKLGLRQGLMKGVAVGSNGVTFAIWALMAWYGSKLVMDHGGKGGTVFAVGAGIVTGGLALGSGLSNIKYFSEASSAGERIVKVTRRVPRIDSENTDGVELENLSGAVEFRSVEFAYPSRPENIILSNFNLKVEAGTTVALVGGSGSGKSTCIALMERFYDPSKGEILLDEVDIKNIKIKWLRSKIGLVSQEPALFATSIKENLLFGKEDATMEEVVAAAIVANAHGFISQLPQGYDTQVGERGVQMSGGQKQRIAIARAVLKSPKILLLDEATSALDSKSERIVQEALDQASVGRTTIVVAHRLSTIRNADVIAVVQGGQVVELGTHDDLIRNDYGRYSSLVRLQQTKTTATDVESSSTSEATVGASAHRQSGRSSRRFSGCSRSSSAKSLRLQDDDRDFKKMALPTPSMWRLLQLNSPEWPKAMLGSLGAIGFGAVQPLYSLTMGSMISVYFLPDPAEIKSKTRTYCLIFFAIAVFSFLVNILQHYNFGAMGEFLTKRVRERMLSKILTFEVGWFDQDENSTGAICSRLANDANMVRMLVGDRMSLIIQTISAVTIAWALGLAIGWKLALVLIAIQPVTMFCYYSRKVILQSMSQKAIKAQSESSKVAAEAVASLRTITAFSSQDRILHLFERTQEGPSQESVRQSWVAGIVLGLAQGLMRCSWSLAFWWGGKLMFRGELAASALFQNIFIVVTTGRVIAEAGSTTSDLAKGADSVSSVFAVLDRYTQIEPEEEEGHRPEKLVGDIDIREIDFAYPARPDVSIFRGFSLTIESGKSTALVGQSGSGKSTIIGLIERFYDPLRGTVKIDGRDVKSYHLRSIRRHIGLVGQEPALFAGTIRENIAFGTEEEPTAAEVEDAARTANAHDFISGLKDGYETYCGERGAQLSGGQKQRIAIARAVLKNPSILLLDEATSALDSRSEKEVQAALERVMVGRTSVVVAHRLSTVQNCDLIAVMEKGNVVEKGTHASLLSVGPSGVYYGLVSLQSR
ncbi:multidrug resistance protein [Canna indica]|uniref:Multidrug resistance protein n=1 Tax=Canna indica TaxID=4628 RepID=A0AAQ3JVI5_9LILI|nr:multidrug resistance protein [Canna indica]